MVRSSLNMKLLLSCIRVPLDPPTTYPTYEKRILVYLRVPNEIYRLYTLSNATSLEALVNSPVLLKSYLSFPWQRHL
jgi:hypothetical protein